MLIDATTESLHPLEQIFFELKYSPTIEMAASLHAMECPKHFPSQKDRVDATRAKMGPDLRSEFNCIARETLGFAPVMDLIDHLERSDIDNIALFLDRLADVDPVEFAYGYFSGLIPKRTIRALLKDPQARIPEGEALGHYFPEKSLRAYFEIQDELRPRIASFLKAYWTDVFAREWDHIGAVEIRRLSEEKHALAAIGHRAYLAGCHAGISVDDDAVRLQKSMGFTIPYRSIKKVEIVISAYVRPHLMMNCFDDVLTIYKGVDMAISDRETSFAEVEKFAKARENGGSVVAVDPRYAGADMLADEWVAVRPGSELAFLLGIMGEVALEGTFDADFVARYGEGFEEFRGAMLRYTPAWAAEQCGVAEHAVHAAAQGLVKAAPHCHVDIRPGMLLGCGYATSFETVRCAVLLNAMLGAVNQTGGMFLAKIPAIDESVFENAPFTKVTAAGESIAQTDGLGVASCQEALEAAAKGGADVALFVECDPAADWPDSAKVEEDLDNIGFKVVVDSVLTETAHKADYVLPAATYLEAESVVAPVAAAWSLAEKRNRVVAPAGEARAVHRIFTDLATACGKGDDFAFGLDDVNDALCKAYGVTLDGLKDTACCAIPNAAVHAGDAPAIGTESGRIPFAGDAFAQAGLDRVPRYTDPEATSDDGMPRLITGAQSMQMRTYTADAETIAAFAKDMAA
ncbi:MAG: DUF5937 family protein, partial [Slackia sp.]|nr:DUF5937 family protein [Slackia sp.]